MEILEPIPYFFDVCLIDYRIGADAAEEVSRRITEHSHELPLILMSGYERSELQGRIPDDLLMYFINKAEMSSLLLELSIRHAINSSSPIGLSLPESESDPESATETATS